MKHILIRRVMALLLFGCLFIALGNNNTLAAAKPTFSSTNIVIYAGETYSLKINNQVKDSKLSWSSSNTKVATVDQSGKIKAVGEGSANIVCKLKTKTSSYNLTGKVFVKAGNEIGNTSGNLMNGGYAAAQDDWIYYSDISQSKSLYKMKNDGLEKPIQLTDDSCEYINVKGSYVYYKSGKYIRRIKTDGTGRQDVMKCSDYTSIAYLQILKDKLYVTINYDLYESTCPIYRMNLDGSGAEKVGIAAKKFIIDGNYIYCGSDIESSTSTYYCKIRSGIIEENSVSQITQITTARMYSSFGYKEKFLYYIAGNNNLYKMNVNNSESRTFIEDKVGCCNISGDYIFYQNINDNNYGEIRSADIGSKAVKTIYSSGGAEVKNINVAGNWLFFYSDDWYRIKLDGTNLAKVSDKVTNVNTNQVQDPAETNIDSGKSGNTSGNLINGGYAAIQGDWIFYRNDYDFGCLYRIKSSGEGDPQLISSDSVKMINAIGNYVYYACADGIYRMNNDGKNKKLISKMEPDYMQVIGNTIYYTKNHMYKMNLDGSNVSDLGIKAKTFIFEGNKLYYTQSPDSSLSSNYSLYCSDANGSNSRLVTRIANFSTSPGTAGYFITGNHLFFQYNGHSVQDNYKLAKVDLNTIEDVVYTTDDTVTYSNFNSEGVYYCSTGGFYYMSYNSNTPVLISDCDGYGFNVVGEWIYFFNFDKNQSQCRMKIDGTSIQEIK